MKSPRSDLNIELLNELLFNPNEAHIKIAAELINTHFANSKLSYAYKLITYVADHRPHSWLFLAQVVKKIPAPPKPLDGSNFVFYLIKKGVLHSQSCTTRGLIKQSADELESGYPLNSLSHYIRVDDLDRIIGSPIDAEVFRMKLKLGDKEAPILGFAMYYNSERIVKWLLANECQFESSVAEFAIMSGNMHYVQMCHQKGISLRNYVNIAIEYHYNDLIREIIGKNKISYDIQQALRIHNTLFLAWLGTSKNLILDKGDGGMTPILKAAGDNNVEYLIFLESKGAKVSSKDKQGTNALIRASRHGAIDVVRHICDEKSHIDQTDNSGNSALMWASLKGHSEIMKILIEKGADVYRKNNKGVSPMYNALQSKSDEAVEVLASNGADLEEVMTGGATPLITAILNGQMKVIDILLDHGANPDTRDSYGSTPLMHAAKEWLLKICIKLIKHGAHHELQDPKGLTALQYTYCDEIKEMLKGIRD